MHGRELPQPEPEPLEITMEGLLEAYLEEHLVRPATGQTYGQAVRRWVKETGITDPRGVTRQNTLEWRNSVLGRTRPETWNKYRRHLRALFNYALGRDWVVSNPFKEIPPARTDHPLKKTVDPEVISRALAILKAQDETGGRLEPAWLWAMVVRAIFYTGVRRRQIIELRWRDVNLGHGVWRIRAETTKTRREWLVPLAPEVIEDLEVLHERTRERLGVPPEGEHQVYNVTLFYPRYKGPELCDNQIGGFFHRLSTEVGTKITPHRMRHTMATLLAAHGDIRTLQELLGHTNISTTMGYVHPDAERMRTLVAHLPDL